MPNDLLLGVVVSFVGYLLLTLTGINGMRHARLLGLGFDGYLMASVWLWIALFGILNLTSALMRIRAFGMPSAVVYASGHVEPFTFGLRNWTGLIIGFAICLGLCIRSFVMIGNAKRQDAEGRKAAGELQRAMVQVRRIRNG